MQMIGVIRVVRTGFVVAGLLNFVLAAGYFLQEPWATATWPWPTGRLTFVFIAAMLAAVGAALTWIGLARDWGAVAPGALNLFVMFGGLAAFMMRAADGQAETTRLATMGFGAALVALFNLALFLWAVRLPPAVSGLTPRPVRFSYALFGLVLLAVGVALIRNTPNVMPWPLQRETSVAVGWMFFGDAFYFLYAVVRPAWGYARAQLWSFVAYDVVLIGPLVAHLANVPVEFRTSLLVYIGVLLYSGALGVYYLFIHRSVRVLSVRG